MKSVAIEVNAVEPIVIDTRRVGQTVEIRVCRHSDGFFLDWSDDTFKAVGVVVTLDQTLVAKDATNAPGIYQLASVTHPSGLDTSLFGLVTTADDSLLVIVNVTAGPAFATTNIPSGEIRLKCLVDGVLTEKTVQSRVNSMARGKIALSGAVVKPPQDAEYFDEAGVSLFTNRNTGTERNPV